MQRVASARVEVADQLIDAIGTGLLFFVGLADDDQESDLTLQQAKADCPPAG